MNNLNSRKANSVDDTRTECGFNLSLVGSSVRLTPCTPHTEVVLRDRQTRQENDAETGGQTDRQTERQDDVPSTTEHQANIQFE